MRNTIHLGGTLEIDPDTGTVRRGMSLEQGLSLNGTLEIDPDTGTVRRSSSVPLQFRLTDRLQVPVRTEEIANHNTAQILHPGTGQPLTAQPVPQPPPQHVLRLPQFKRPANV